MDLSKEKVEELVSAARYALQVYDAHAFSNLTSLGMDTARERLRDTLKEIDPPKCWRCKGAKVIGPAQDLLCRTPKDAAEYQRSLAETPKRTCPECKGTGVEPKKEL